MIDHCILKLVEVGSFGRYSTRQDQIVQRYGYLGSAFGSGLGAVMGTSPARSSGFCLSQLQLQKHSHCSSSVVVGVVVVAKCDVAEVIIHNESAAGVQEGGRTGQWSQPNRWPNQ